jgi:hypothetical protein
MWRIKYSEMEIKRMEANKTTALAVFVKPQPQANASRPALAGDAELPPQADVQDTQGAERKNDEHKSVEHQDAALDAPGADVEVLQRAEEYVD